jgi:hypothetical protein
MRPSTSQTPSSDTRTCLLLSHTPHATRSSPTKLEPRYTVHEIMAAHTHTLLTLHLFCHRGKVSPTIRRRRRPEECTPLCLWSNRWALLPGPLGCRGFGGPVSPCFKGPPIRRPAAGPILLPSGDTVRHDAFGVFESVIDCRVVNHQLSA